MPTMAELLDMQDALHDRYYANQIEIEEYVAEMRALTGSLRHYEDGGWFTINGEVF